MSFKISDIVVNGQITAGTIVKSGGTSAQFLKADGSVDSNTYLTSVSDVWVNTSGDTMTGSLVIRNTGSFNNIRVYTEDDNSWIEQTKPDGTIVGRMGFDGYSTGNAYYTEYAVSTRSSSDAGLTRRIYVTDGRVLVLENLNGFTYNGNAVWHAGNDGSGSGLDADLLDGLHASSFTRKDATAQYLRPYYEYTSYLSTETPSTLASQMGGSGLRVDFIYNQSFGTWGQAITWSAYSGYNMYQLAGHYKGSGGDGPDLYVRCEPNHQLNSWSPWQKIWHTGNLTNLNQLTNGPGYITSYTETDTLATVTGRGASTSTALTLSGRVTFGSAIADRPQMPNGILGLDTGDGNFDIWGISRDYYPSNATAGNAWGILWNGDNNQVRFIGAGTQRLVIDLDGGSTGALTWEGNNIWHAGNLTNLNQLSNGPGYITSSGSITGSAGSVAWTNVTGRPSSLSSFTNDIVARTTLNASGDFQFGGQDLANNNFSLSGATTDTDQFGRYYYSGTSGSFWSRYLPVDKSGKYRMKIRWKASAASGTYIAVILLDTSGNNINGAGTYWAYPWSGSGAPTSWTTNEYWYDGSSFPANAAYVAFGISHTNYGGGSATYYVSQLEIERYSDQISGNAIINAGGSYANPSWITSLAWSKITGAPAFITSYTETDTLASVTGRGASTNSVVTFNGNVLTSAGLSDTSYVRINNPGGGSYVTQSSVITGAIRIKLPTQGSAMMMTCTVKVYEYSTNRSFTITFGGHRDSNNWYNEFCYLDGADARGELTVRFGVDGGKDCVYIGETNTSWSYPQVFVTDVQLGYAGYSATWLSGWEVAFVTGFSTVNRTQTAYRKLTPANYNSYAPTLTGGGASGTWSINVTGSSGSSGQVTHNASRTDGTWYNVGWFSGNPSPAYSSDSVRILSSQGALRANLYYDNEDTAYYLDPNNASVLEYVEGSNDASFRGANRAINDWDYSGLTTNPTVNGYDDGSWFIDCGASNDWSRGLLSKRRFRRVENLTLEYEAYLEASTGGCIHYMIGFVGGDSTNYSYCQTPSNLNYHDCSNMAVYTNCSGSGSDYDFDSRNAWWRFKIVLKGSGARHYVYRGDEWRLIKDTTTNNQNDYEWVRVLVSGYRQRLYLRDVKVYVADAHRRGSEYISSIAGRLRVSTDVRTPIMYDSNNENYYCDPDLYSSLWGVAIRGDYSAGGAGNQLFLWGAGGTTTSGIGFKQVGGVWADHGATSGGYNTYFTMDTLNRGWVFRRATVGGSDWTGTNVASISNTGHAQFDGSVRSPIFYDSVNTNYYLDAASGSRLHRITLDQSRVDSSRYPVGHYTPNDTVFEIDPTWSEDQLQAYFNSSSVYWTNDSTAPGGYAIRIDGNVNVGGTYGSGFPYIPVDQDDVFYMECWIRSWDGSQGHYMGSIDFNSGFGSLGGNPGSFGYWVMSGTTTSSSWQKVSGYISGFGGSTGQFVNGTKYWTPQALFNYSNNSGTHRCVISGWKAIRVSHAGNRTFRNSVTIAGNQTTFGTITSNTYITSSGAVYASNWFRTYGNSGWYSETHGGGMYMEDATWVRVYGSKQFYVANNSANAIAAAGDIVAYYSDERLKQKVGKVENALDKIRSLTAFYYTTNDLAKSFGYEKSEQQLGLSAQEVQKIAPEIVSLAPFDMKTLEDGSVVSKTGENYLTVKYDRLVPVLVEAIKEQQAQIEELKAKLDGLTK